MRGRKEAPLKAGQSLGFIAVEIGCKNMTFSQGDQAMDTMEGAADYGMDMNGVDEVLVCEVLVVKKARRHGILLEDL